jgi:hypothetical protein
MRIIGRKFLEHLRGMVFEEVDFDIEVIDYLCTRVYFRTGLGRLSTSAVLELTEIGPYGDFELVFNMGDEISSAQNDLKLSIKHNSSRSLLDCCDKIRMLLSQRGMAATS